MKIEPAVYVRKKAIDFLNGASKTAYVEAKLCRTKTDDFELTYPLYTEAQMRQLGEACAALVETQHSTKDEQTYGLIAGELIRNLIKEMLG